MIKTKMEIMIFLYFKIPLSIPRYRILFQNAAFYSKMLPKPLVLEHLRKNVAVAGKHLRIVQPMQALLDRSKFP